MTRLDGYTESDAKALVDRATASETTPYHVLLDIDPSKGITDSTSQPLNLLLPNGTLNPSYTGLTYGDYNADMAKAASVLAALPYVSTVLDNTNAFVGSSFPLTLYVSWGSNDAHYSATTYHSLTFAPGGIAETAVSTSGRTFLPTSGGQSLVADLIAQGATGVKGYASEPFLDGIASPTVLSQTYMTGRNLAESYYAASRFVGWKDIIVGDPLCTLSIGSPGTVSAAKALPNGTYVSLSGKIATSGGGNFADRFYIEEPDRSSGIQVQPSSSFANVTAGDTVSVSGTLATIDGERVITSATYTIGQ